MNTNYYPRTDESLIAFAAQLHRTLASDILFPVLSERAKELALIQKELEDAMYAYKWIMMGDTSAPQVDHPLIPSLKKGGGTANAASPDTAARQTKTGEDAPAGIAAAPVKQMDIPAPLKRLLAQQVRITDTSTALTALLAGTPVDGPALTAAAWDHADAGGMLHYYVERITERDAVIAATPAGVAAELTGTAVKSAGAAEESAGAHAGAANVQDFNNVYINEEKIAA